MPKVSIIVPVYNAEKALDRCISSILNQEYKDIELILVNDGSKDSSKEIIDHYASIDDRVIAIHKENSGVSSTRNLALDKASGDYVQFLDADDWIPDNSTKSMVRAMEDYNVDLVVSDFYRVVGENVAKKGSIETGEPLTRNQYIEFMMEQPADYYYGVIWNKLYRREIIEKYHLRMEKDINFCEDFIFNLEYLLNCKSVYPLQVPVYYYVKTEGSLVSQIDLAKIIKSKITVFEYYKQFFDAILEEDHKEFDRLSMGKYLIAAAHDNFALPLFPGTKKLGEEGIQTFFTPEKRNSIVSITYYMEKAFARRLDEIAHKYNLELNDVKILMTIRESEIVDDIRELMDYYNLSLPSVLMSLQRLAFKHLIKFDLNIDKLTAELTENADDICIDLDRALADVAAASYKDMSEEEKETASDLLNRIMNNLKDYLS